jgi:hypothetical protein
MGKLLAHALIFKNCLTTPAIYCELLSFLSVIFSILNSMSSSDSSTITSPFLDVNPKHVGHYISTVCIKNSQQQVMTLGSMDMDVLDIHKKVLLRFFCFDFPKTNKMSGNTIRANSAVKQ